MPIDRLKMAKIETILAALHPDEQRHIATYAASLNPGPSPAPAIHAPAPAPAVGTVGSFNRQNMHQQLRRGDLVEFTDRRRQVQRARVVSINTKTVTCEPTEGHHPGWRVSPTLLRLVGQHPPVPAPARAPVSTGAMPTATGAGSW